MGGVKSTRKTGKSGRPIGFARRDAVETAMNLVWKKGFLSVSVKELAEAMSIRRSSFYNTFGGREELFREVLAMYGTRTADAPLDHVRPGEPVVPVIVSVMRDLCRARVPIRQGIVVAVGSDADNELAFSCNATDHISVGEETIAAKDPDLRDTPLSQESGS